ncbi:hypothetical protein D3C77_254480 [compost metagenome]
MQGQGEEIGVLPAAGAQVGQHCHAAGIEVADAAEQLQAFAFGQMLQAVDQQGQVEALSGQILWQRARLGLGNFDLRVRLGKGLQGWKTRADQQQTLR